MEPKFQNSFIPKKPIVSGGGERPAVIHHTNIFSVIAALIFVIALLACGGVFVYKNILTGQVADSDKELNEARAAFQTEQIKNIIDTSARILSIKTLLEKHVAVSELLFLLESLTLQRIRFNDFVYTNRDDNHTVSMSTEAKTYSTLASQSAVFAQNRFIVTPEFSDFNLVENGNIRAKFFSKILPELISYKHATEDLVGAEPQMPEPVETEEQ